ncbi:MAG: TlpA disulfide reductase family protein [Hyphomicrobiales bacterium]|nr:TlpA disulfide reductase family protein [Hyphomicrobiales bacterium]
MNSEGPIRKGRNRWLLAGGGLAAILMLAGVYVTLWPQGNGEGIAECHPSATVAAALKPLARGEMAALLVADEPAPAAEISFIDAAGTPRALADWAGRTVLVNLWATWCTPCKREMPALDRLQAELGGETFEVVAINLDLGGPDKGKTFYGEVGLKSLAYYHDPEARIFRAVNAIGMPTTLIVDGKGCEIARVAGPAEWASEDALALLRAAIGGT